MEALKKLVSSFQNPEKRLKIDAGCAVSGFAFDSTFQHLFLGFDNGEVSGPDPRSATCKWTRSPRNCPTATKC